MAQRIDLVPGGYQGRYHLVGHENFISAKDLIPFGGFEEFPDNQKISIYDSNDLEDLIKEHKGIIQDNAIDYADKMNAPFFRLRLTQETRNTSLRTIGKVQLYVFNLPIIDL